MQPADTEQAHFNTPFAKYSKAPPQWDSKANSQSIQVHKHVSGDKADSAEAQSCISVCLSSQNLKNLRIYCLNPSCYKKLYVLR